VSAAHDSLAAARFEADEGLVAQGECLRAQAELVAAQRGNIYGLAALLRGMDLGPPGELVAELRREVALARFGRLKETERTLQALLEASLFLAESSGAGASSAAAPSPSASADGRLRAQLLEGPLRCPISLETMTDPVILAESGHTFERAAILQWLARPGGASTCPLSKQPLATRALVPNFALRSQLSDMGLPLAPLLNGTSPVLLPAARMANLWGRISAPDSEEVLFLVSHNGDVEGLARLLSSSDPEAQAQASWALSSLAAENDALRERIASTAGALPGLAALLGGASEGAAEQAARALRNLAVCSDALRERIASTAGALPGLAALLGGTSAGAAEQAEAALVNLAAISDALCKRIASTAGVLPGLAALLGSTTASTTEQAAAALRNLAAGSDALRKRIASTAGVLPGLAAVLGGASAGPAEQAAAALANLAAGSEALCKCVASTAGVLPGLAALLGGASAGAAEQAAAALSNLAWTCDALRERIATTAGALPGLAALLGDNVNPAKMALGALSKLVEGTGSHHAAMAAQCAPALRAATEHADETLATDAFKLLCALKKRARSEEP